MAEGRRTKPDDKVAAIVAEIIVDPLSCERQKDLAGSTRWLIFLQISVLHMHASQLERAFGSTVPSLTGHRNSRSNLGFQSLVSREEHRPESVQNTAPQVTVHRLTQRKTAG